MEKFRVVSNELLPVQSLTQFLIDIGVTGLIVIQADDGGHQKVSVEQLDAMVLQRGVTFCVSKAPDSAGAWSVVPLYVEGERFTVKKAWWNPAVGEVELTLRPAKTAAIDVSWTIPMCRYKIGGGSAGLRPRMSAWWVPRPSSDI